MWKTQSNNTAIIAAAGSRKTTYVVDEAINRTQEKILILTYTIYNLNQIRQYFIEKIGIIPSNVTVQSWYQFLLQDCSRPYQGVLYDKKRIETIFFIEGKSCPYVPRRKTGQYYFADDDRIYTDKISEFACNCNSKSGGLVIRRLENIYDCIFIDEIQDLAGYDFDFLELLFKSQIKVTVVGDNRQATYFTNCSPKNCKFKGQNVIVLFKDWEKRGLCRTIERNECYRCNQQVCNIADGLYPDMPKTQSKNLNRTGHDGVFTISASYLKTYINQYNPMVLRYSKITKTEGLRALNFGVSKGQSFDRVLIFPNGPIKDYLKTKNVAKLTNKTKALLYVAITRARYSVAFVYDDHCCIKEIQKM
ncbi:MAG: UvrD-helicase domain-containing protein [Phycisphaerae bacterium]|jgi:DNA helicase-2/ATP-dependent DNA helicase PcrA